MKPQILPKEILNDTVVVHQFLLPKRKQNLYILLILILIINVATAQKIDSLTGSIKYRFKVIEGTSKSTLNQSYNNILTLNRLISRGLNKNNSKVSLLLQVIIPTISMGISHEEGHRSVLTEIDIGSINQPFSYHKGLLYVKGVMDTTLINLRNGSLPDYIHLHTAGLESDYMSILELENNITFILDDFDHLKYDYFTRKLSHLFYFLTTISPFLFPEINEEENELERDIVGHDILGTIRHLHRPNDSFFRYTFFNDLNVEEKKFALKISLFSLSNLISPMLIGKKYFSLPNDYQLNFSMGYNLSPFGGHLDQNFWVKKEKINLFFYLREFHNKNNWFFGTGMRIISYPINNKTTLNFGIHYWNQPVDLKFQSMRGFTGIGGEIDFSHNFFSFNKNDISIVTGIRYKDKGFLPGYSSLNEKTQINIGFEFSF